MKRTALLVFVGVSIGVVSMVGFVWFHEVGQHELQRLMDGYDSSLYAKKQDHGVSVAEVEDPGFKVNIPNRPAVTFVQNPPAAGRKVLADEVDRADVGDVFEDGSLVVRKAVPSKTVRTPPALERTETLFSNDSFDRNVGTTTIEPVIDRSTIVGVNSGKLVKSTDAQAGNPTEQPILMAPRAKPEHGESWVESVVPQKRTVVEKYVDTDGQVKTREHQVTEYARVRVRADVQVEIDSFRKAVEALKSAKEETERNKATEEVRASLHKYFQRDMQRREKELSEAEGRVKKLREQFDKRKAAELEIVNLRLQIMINEATGLGFSLPFDEGNPSATVGPAYPASNGSAVPIYAPEAQPMLDGPGQGLVMPPPTRRNRGKDDDEVFAPRIKVSPSGPAPLWNPKLTPKPDVIPQRSNSSEDWKNIPDPKESSGTTAPLPKPSVSQWDLDRDLLKDSGPEPESIEGNPSLAPSESPRESESVPVVETPELEAIEVETNRTANELPSDKPLSPEQIELRRSSARTGVLIKNLTFPVEARSIVAARELGRLGEKAAAAVPELERLINMERDEKGFPSDKQREAFLDALIQIKGAIATESGDSDVSEHGTEIDFPWGLTTKQKVRLLTNHLVWHGGAHSLAAAKQLEAFGKDAASAMPKLEELIKIKQDAKGFPSDEQRKGFQEALEKIKAAAKAEEGEKPKSSDAPT